MSNCAIVGINWGDEGKGRMVDLLTQDYDVVVRYQGGGNAGHTVVNEQGKFALHLLPSGIFRKGVVNILGNGVALDCESLWTEITDVTGKGVSITPENLKISDRASLLLPWHRDLDGLEEARLKDKKYGSSGRHPGVEEPDPDQGLRRQALHHGRHEGLGGRLRREDQALHLRHRRVFAQGQQGGQEHPLRGPAGFPAGSGLRHLSHDHLLQPHRRLCTCGLRLS